MGWGQKHGWKISVEHLASMVPGAMVVDVSEKIVQGFLERLDISIYNSLYKWLVSRGFKDNGSLHNRTFTGANLKARLDHAERIRLRRRIGGSGKNLNQSCIWSDLDAGPREILDNHLVVGEALCIVPEAERDNLASQLMQRSYDELYKKLKRERARMRADDFYHWLIGAREHDDPIGDLANDVYRDDEFPKHAVHWEEINSYFVEHGWTIAETAHDEAWLEYLAIYPERGTRLLWCSGYDCHRDRELYEGDWLVYSDQEGFKLRHDHCLREDGEIDHKLPIEDFRTGGLVIFDRLVEQCGHIAKVGYAPNFRRALVARGFTVADTKISYVYFIQVGADGPIKIGRSTDVIKRLASLQTAHHTQLRLLVTQVGDANNERMLHQRFVHLRREGEWFAPESDLLAYIESLRQR